nr:austinol synthesis protein h [Quercus suber]
MNRRRAVLLENSDLQHLPTSRSSNPGMYKKGTSVRRSACITTFTKLSLTMTGTAQAQAATLDAFVAGWKAWDPDQFLASWSRDCTQHTLPFSAGVPSRSRADTERIFPMLMSFVTNFQLEVTLTVHDPAEGKAAVYAVTKADSPVGPYANEHALFLWFDEHGTKVTRIEEMFDAAFMDGFLPKLHEHMRQQLKERGEETDEFIH